MSRRNCGGRQFLCFWICVDVTPFVIYALPRSKTFWISRWLSYGGWECGHDEIRHLRSIDDARSWFAQPYIGTVETAAAPWWRLADKIAPGIRTVVIRRPAVEVVESLMRLLPFDRASLAKNIAHLNRKLDQIEARVPGALSVRFDELMSEAGCARIFEHCLPYRHDSRWWDLMASLNLQTNLASTMRYMMSHHRQLGRMAGIAKHLTAMSMRPSKMVQRDDVTIQQESCEVWLRDGAQLFREHSIKLGEVPDDYKKRNWPLMMSMDKMGAMQIVTARCNGRMVGYHVCYIAPATDDASLLSSLQISIFVTQDFTGLGSRLQRVSLEILERRGVGEVNFRAGINADGPRMDAFYKRIGATPIGQMYRLPLRTL